VAHEWIKLTTLALKGRGGVARRVWSWSVELELESVELESVELAANVLSEHRQDVQRLGWRHLRIF